MNIGTSTLAVLLVALALARCGSSSSTPTSPTPNVILSGTYAGQASDSSGYGMMTWNVSQSGATVSGTMTAAFPVGPVQFRGNISGRLSGTTLSFSIAIPEGGITAFPSCTVAIVGTAAGVTPSKISGTYSGTGSCTAPFNNGQFTLTK